MCMGWMGHIPGLTGWLKCSSCGYSEQPILKVPNMSKLTKDQAIQRYGEIKDGKWANEAQFMVMLSVPPQILSNWINAATGKPTTKIYCNKDLVDPLNKLFDTVIQRKLTKELHTFDGCFNIRDVRGVPGQLSWHSYGLAIDINAKDNPLGGQSTLNVALVNCFLDVGFVWGGEFSRKDPMHFQYAVG